MRTGKILTILILIFFLLGMIFPLIWMVSLSFSSQPIQLQRLFDFLPDKFSLRNYIDLFKQLPFGRFLFNSIFVGITVTLGNVIFCLMVGYALARKEFRFKKILFFSILMVMMLPAHILIIPLFLLVKNLGWYDTYLALIIPWLVNPLGIFIVRQYVQALPSDFEEAARIDGAGELKIVFKILMPLCKPALAVVAIHVFLTNWNSFLFPFILTSSEDMRTLPVALALYQGYQTIDWPHLLAGSTLATLPVVILFLIFQRQIVEGLTAGGIKT